jgi:hypothetical protein
MGAGRGGVPSPLEDHRQGPVVEVLYVEHCPNFPAALALVERVAAELGINAEVRATIITDQTAAERTRFVGSPTIRVDGRDVDPDGELPASTPWSVACTGMSIAWPATPRSGRSVRRSCGRPVGAEQRELTANALQPDSSSRHTTTPNAKAEGTIPASPPAKRRPCLFSHGSYQRRPGGTLPPRPSVEEAPNE